MRGCFSLYYHACAADSLRERLEELRVKGPETRPLPAAVRRLGAELEMAQDTAELVVGVHVVVGGWLLAAHAHYRAATDALMDLPTLRRLRPVVADLEDMRAWAAASCDAWVAAGRAATELAAWRGHLAPLVDALDADPGDEPAPSTLRATARGPYRRPMRAARDVRMTTFADTRRYSAEADGETNFAATALAMARVQRDELDAIETFANVLYDAAPMDLPAALRLHLARMIWDEARHAEMGQQLLGHLGHDPFAVPCGVLGIQVRAPLPPTLAFAQIHAFGELQQVARLRSFARRAAAAGDTTLARCFDFTHADELMHCRRSRPWLQELARAEGLSLAALQERARRAAVAQLHAAGVVGEDYTDAAHECDLGALLGE